MKKSQKIALAIATVVIVALLVVAAITGGSNNTVDCPDCDGIVSTFLCETCGGEGSVRASVWAILPAVIAIALALITKEVYSSLFIGIVSGALIYSNFSFTGTFDAITSDGLITEISDVAFNGGASATWEAKIEGTWTFAVDDGQVASGS